MISLREVKKCPNGFKSGTHEIDADGKDRFPINRDSESDEHKLEMADPRRHKLFAEDQPLG